YCSSCAIISPTVEMVISVVSDSDAASPFFSEPLLSESSSFVCPSFSLFSDSSSTATSSSGPPSSFKKVKVPYAAPMTTMSNSTATSILNKIELFLFCSVLFNVYPTLHNIFFISQTAFMYIMRQLFADISQIPRFIHVAGNIFSAFMIADDKAVYVSVVFYPLAFRRLPKTFQQFIADTFTRHIHCEPRLMFTGPGRRAETARRFLTVRFYETAVLDFLCTV